MISRTNLKQQLQRELMQEQEKKEAEQKQFLIEQKLLSHSAPSHSSSAITVPSSHSVVELPRQILQVQSRLENPTHYHVVQSQKRQVHQYLSNTHGTGGQSFQESAIGSSPQIDPMSPLQLQNTCDPTPNSPLSVGLSSSAATSPSEVEEFWDDFTQLGTTGVELDMLVEIDCGTKLPNTMPGNTNIIDLFSKVSSTSKVSASCPAEVARIKEETSYTGVDFQALVKDRQKKDNHNMIERRRRYNINDRIKELGLLLPKNNDPFSELTRDSRQNKGNILKASVDYLRHLKREVEKIPLMEERRRQLEQQNKKLICKIEDLEFHMKMHGLLGDNQQQSQKELTSSGPAKEILHVNFKQEQTERPGLIVCQNDDLSMDNDLPNINADPMLSWNSSREAFLLEKMDILS